MNRGPLSAKKAFIFDLDGCIHRGERVVEGAADVIARLRQGGRRVIFITNNATRTPGEYAERLGRMGIEADAGEFITSAVATAEYMKGLSRGGCYVVGAAAISPELTRAGFTVLEEGGAGEAEYVVCGLDMDFSYRKLAAACFAIQGGAKFIATNRDPRLPVEGGYLPGAGSIVAAISAATGKRPVVIGKPSRRIMEVALRRFGLTREETAIVGDSLDTDIKAGRNAGVFTVLVLTGVTSKEDVCRRGDIRPDLVVESVADLLGMV